jgi:hypothetical protein
MCLAHPCWVWVADECKLVCGELALDLAVHTVNKDNSRLGCTDGVLLGVLICMLKPGQPDVGTLLCVLHCLAGCPAPAASGS